MAHIFDVLVSGNPRLFNSPPTLTLHSITSLPTDPVGTQESEMISLKIFPRLMRIDLTYPARHDTLID